MEATYPYHDASGQVAFEVVRFVFKQVGGGYVTDARGKRKKTFRQRRPSGRIRPELAVGSRGRRIHAPGARRRIGSSFNAAKFEQYPATRQRKVFNTAAPVVPYQLPDLLKAVAAGQTICIAEGEKKVDLIRSFGFPATCCAGGAKKWSPEHSAFLQGADVVLLPDNDPVGREHVEAIAESLAPAPGGYVSSNYLTCRRRATSSTGTRRAAAQKSSPASSQPPRITCPMRPRDRSR